MTQQGRFARRAGVRRLVPYSLLPHTLALSSLLLTTVLVLAADSDLDPSFDGDGIVTTDHDEFDEIRDIVIQPDGKIVVAGDTGFFHLGGGDRTSIIVARYNADGSLDATFGNNGIVITAIGQHSLGNAIALQDDGKIVVVGEGQLSQGQSFAVVRYNANGSLDGSFGNGGVVTTLIGTRGFLTDVAIQPDGKIVASGNATIPGGIGGVTTTTVARYNTDGSLDVTFDGDGVTQAIPPGFGFPVAGIPSGVALQQDQKIVVAGDCDLGALTDFCVSRYNSDGSLDSTFDGDGIAITSFDAVFGSSARDVLIQPNGKILAAGVRFVTNGVEAVLARYNDDGSRDTLFDGDGRVITATSQLRIAAIALQSDGKILAVGDSSDGAVLRITVLRYKLDGTLDNTFGNGGIVTTPIGTLGGNGNAIAVQPDGNIVVGGLANFDLEGSTFLSDFALVRYGEPNPNGGFVSGGGWIDSPPGALVARPSATGKAQFAFVAKYQKGANVPTGNMRFQLNAGDLSFQSTSYEWLVVSGWFARCRGTGTINGSGNYRFLLSSVDGDQPGGGGLDKLRIKIWSDSDGLIYDNQLNAPQTDAATSVVGGGSITIHR